MTEPSDSYDIDLDRPLDLTDYIEIVADALDEAVDKLERSEVERLCAAVRQKVSTILREHRMSRADDAPAPDSNDDRDPGNRWWDRP